MPSEEGKDEGFVATSASHWVHMVKERLGISNDDPNKNKKLWDFCVGEQVFSSGSTLTIDDYLRLRVIWYTYKDVNDFREYMRNKTGSHSDNVGSGVTGTKSTPYMGYVSPEIDEISKKICRFIRPEWKGYLDDIGKGDGKDITRPSRACSLFYMARYNQAMTMTRTKEGLDERRKQDYFPPRARKSAIGIESSNSTPQTPPESSATQSNPTENQPSPTSPRVSVVGSSAGGLQNPATSDETYVNTALLELLNIVTRLCGDLEDEATQDAEHDLSATATKFEGLEIGSTNAYDLSATLSKVDGLRHLDWLADRLALHLQDRTGPKPKVLMKARVDGFLCRRGITKLNNGTSKVRYNNLPLAILEAKSFTRSSGITSIRYQESAEIACWVSGLHDDYEEVGLLQSSNSGRKRRLLISQDRHELWIIIAEYGEEWKQYIRGQRFSIPSDSDKSLPQNAEQMVGSEGYVALVKGIDRGRSLGNMIDKVEKFQQPEPRTRSESRTNIQTPRPNHFCIMHQFGPFKTNNAPHMDLFLRRIIALQLQLLTNCPRHGLPGTEA